VLLIAATVAAMMTREQKGWWLGLLGVALFALTLPMTRLAVGPAQAPQLAPLFVTAGRAVVAAGCSVLYLLWLRAPRPTGAQWRWLALSGAGTVIGFPLCLALALREVPAVHGAVVTGVLPLGTAVAAALVLRQRPAAGFWACAGLGCALVLGYAAWRGGGAWHAADGLLLLAVACASIGYVYGARLAGQMGAQQVICWVLVLALPVTLPLALASWPAQPQAVRPPAWLGFGYVSLFSMWIGFFAWYRALALGGTLRVSQVQLVQPFLSLLLAVPLLGESLDAVTVWFALAVIGTVFLGRRMPAAAPPAAVVLTAAPPAAMVPTAAPTAAALTAAAPARSIPA
jgi:drug/metabolite transporter (DMT)-like permease